MAAFRFKYEAIEKIKEQIKKNTEKEYSVILKKIEHKKSEIEAVKELIEKSYTIKNHLSAKDAIFLNQYRASLKDKVVMLNQDLDELNLEKDKKMEELVAHHQEHKVFEKLHEKHEEIFHSEELKKENKQIDEIANQKFNRKENN